MAGPGLTFDRRALMLASVNNSGNTVLESVVIVVLAGAVVLAALYVRQQRDWRKRVSLLQGEYYASRLEVSKLGLRIEALEGASLMTGLPFDPRDARMLGDPVGCVVFAGRHEGGRVEEVVFVEARIGEAAPGRIAAVCQECRGGRAREIHRSVASGDGGRVGSDHATATGQRLRPARQECQELRVRATIR